MRKRANGSENLPVGLYKKFDKKSGVTYYQHLNRVTRKFTGLGTDEQYAIKEANRRNALHADIRAQLKAGAFFRNGVPCLRGGAIESDGLYSANSITAAARPVDFISGIYFLIQDYQIVYVGQSKDALTRLSSHCRSGEKEFTQFVVLECDPCNLDRIEAMYIAKFNPPLNMVKPNADSFRFSESLGNDLGKC